MEVRDLIIELLEFNPSAEVELYINSEEESNDFDFKFEEYQRVGRNYLSVEVDLDKYVMVDKRDYEDMKQKIETLEEDLGEANQKLDEFRNE
ncbi:hypothetical protein [Sporosarcina sp. FSL K6-1508]|uniref:hypothetical protein n=1 Tax=Sporosarcina sp. FSL K6-1508 TaxID=2921553 RepID=UPI0030FCF40F